MNKKTVRPKVNAKEIMIFFLCIHDTKEALYARFIFCKVFSNFKTNLDFFISFLKNLLPSIGLRDNATKLEMITAEAKVIAV